MLETSIGTARFALYWAPELDDPLHAAGSAWLGRDAETGAALVQPNILGVDLAEITADARCYGLHATLKAPFRLACSYAELETTTAALAARMVPFGLPALAVRDLSGFLALQETVPCPALRTLADACVEALEPCRAPLTEADWMRRRRSGLSPEAELRVARWGYHLVFDDWVFHVTLTRRLTLDERSFVLPAVTAHLGNALDRPRQIASVCLVSQAAPGADFKIARRFSLGG